MAIQFSGGIAHKHHRAHGKHSKHDDLNEAKMYLEYGFSEDEELDIYQT